MLLQWKEMAEGGAQRISRPRQVSSRIYLTINSHFTVEPFKILS